MCAQSCPTLREPIDCSPPDSSVHGILQARKNTTASCHFFTPEVLPDPEIEPLCLESPELAGRFSTTVPCAKFSDHGWTLVIMSSVQLLSRVRLFVTP